MISLECFICEISVWFLLNVIDTKRKSWDFNEIWLYLDAGRCKAISRLRSVAYMILTQDSVWLISVLIVCGGERVALISVQYTSWKHWQSMTLKSQRKDDCFPPWLHIWSRKVSDSAFNKADCKTEIYQTCVCFSDLIIHWGKAMTRIR